MIELFFAGTLLGLILSITLGPAFFTIIQTSIDRGFKRAFQISIGVSACDIVFVLISYFGISTISDILEYGNNQKYIGIIGGIILLLFGIYTFQKKPETFIQRSMKHKFKQKNPNFFTFISKGFLLNLINPFLWIFWFSAVSGISQQAPPEDLKQYIITFFSGTIITVFAFDVLKSFVGHRIKKHLRLRTQLYISRVVGIALMLFGLILIVRPFVF